MRDRTDATAGKAGLPSALRYVPAALAAAVASACLLLVPSLTSWTRPWTYGLALKAAGPPAPSRLAVIVTVDDEEGAVPSDSGGGYLAHLAAAILRLDPAVLAVDFPPGPGGTAAGLPLGISGGSALHGPMVLAADFRGFKARAAAPSEGEEASVPDLQPILGRSLYPHLDGAASLELVRGEGLGLSVEDDLRAATAAFAGPLSQDGPAHPAYRFPAFARLERGTVAGLGVETARRMLGVPAASVTHVEGVGVLFDPAHILPVDGEGHMLLRFHEASGLPSVPASRILDGTVRPEEIKGKAVILAAKGKAPIRTVAGYLSPAEIWATSASNLLEKATVSAPAWGGILAVALAIAFSAILLAFHVADLGALATLLLAALLSALYPVLSVAFFVKSSWWLPPELPAFMVLGTWLPFGITRMLSPRRRDRAEAAPIRPAPVYDPLVAMGGGPARKGPPAAGLPPIPRPALPGAPSRPTPPRGTPRTPGASVPAGPFPPAAIPGEAPRPRPASSRERQGPILPATASPPAQPAQPRQPLPADASAPGSAAEVLLRDLAAPAVQAAPAGPGPRPPAAQPAMPHGHNGSITDEIERDAKGGLVRVGKYRIVRKMGFGSGGDVFEGFDTHMGRKVAIKTITKEASTHFDRAAERFVIEAKAAGSLNHPCINTIYDFGSIRDVSYMVLEFLDGVTLSQWMRQNPLPSPREVGHWIQQICSAMDYAHSQKVIHRDLKPANLMVVNEGATIKLLDFGIAKLEDVGLTQTGMTVGTPSYMSPEQLTGSKVSAASDQYSLAVVLYQLFTYKLPYLGTKIPELCNRILKNDLIPITEVNPALGASFWEVLRKALSKAPEDRYPNCMALCHSLEATYSAPQAAPA